MLNHDNAPYHMAISVIEFLAKKGIPVVPQPPYSPYLSSCDFFLSSKLKFYLKGRHFGTVENMEKAVTDQLKVIPVSDFQRCYEEWEQRLRRCVASQGNYLEGDTLDLQFKNKYKVILNQSHYFIYRPRIYVDFDNLCIKTTTFWK